VTISDGIGALAQAGHRGAKEVAAEAVADTAAAEVTGTKVDTGARAAVARSRKTTAASRIQPPRPGICTPCCLRGHLSIAEKEVIANDLLRLGRRGAAAPITMEVAASKGKRAIALLEVPGLSLLAGADRTARRPGNEAIASASAAKKLGTRDPSKPFVARIDMTAPSWQSHRQ